MTKSIINTNQIIQSTCCTPKPTNNMPKLDDSGQKFNDYHGLSEVSACSENTTILLEILKYHGRDVNIVDMYDLFKTIHKEDEEWTKDNLKNVSEAEFEETMKQMFTDALHQLKYTGFLSATRQSTFLFKKNIYGKPKYYSIGTANE